MKIVVKPYGMLGAVENAASFDPRMPVRPCYWGVEGFGFALGFTQMIQAPDAVETRRQFIVTFEEVYGRMPVIDAGGYEPLSAMEWLEMYSARDHRIPVASA